MRLVAALTAFSFMLPGCLFDASLESSPTDCALEHPLEDGFRLTINQSDLYVGYCVEISLDDDHIDSDVTLSLIPESGVVFLPIEGAGRYYIRSHVTLETDNYCANHFGMFEEHPGIGLVELTAENGVICT